MDFKKLLVVISIMFFPVLVNAKIDDNSLYTDDEGYKIVSTNEKYFKTIYVYNNYLSYNNLFSDNFLVNTIEVSKEEYDSYNEDNSNVFGSSNTIQTEYKKLTVSILENGSKYKYIATLDWKKMPSTRSYDILGIGFNKSVKATTIQYETYYCYNNGSCKTEKTYYINSSDSGVGVSFPLPISNEINLLKSTLTLVIDKNISGATVTEQVAVADYSHATKSISEALSRKYIIDKSGIILQSDNSSYYDEIPEVTAKIKCNW